MALDGPIMSLKGQSSDPIIRRRQDYTISRQLPKLFNTDLSGTHDEKGDTILPYMARVHSPVRVTFAPTISVKQKSKISNQTLTAIFNFRPVKRGDRINISRFKAPDSTSPSFQYISPWISITKGNSICPDSRQTQDGEESFLLNSRASTRASSSFPRSVTDIDFNDMQDRLNDISEYSSNIKTNTVSDVDFESASKLESSVSRSVSAKTQTSDKRVTFGGATDSRLTNNSKERNSLSPKRVDPLKPTTSIELQNEVEIGNGDLSDSYVLAGHSDHNADKLNIDHNAKTGDGKNYYPLLVKDGFYYKPLIGDRSLFMRESYPTKPIVYQSDIEQLRFEGHERLMKSAGQTPAHFSMFKDRGSLIRPKDKGMYLEEALKKQQRLSRSADTTRIKRHKTSLELLERPRDRTYEIQKPQKTLQ